MTYKDKLEKLGYNLQDCGNHWRTRAIYRNGKNNTALIIYKDSGVWKDFGADNQSKPFSALVRETLKTDDPKILAEYSVDIEQKQIIREKIEKIEMEKIYPESDLEKLLPMTTFYEKRGISAKTQAMFNCGYAGGGKMYRRIVFPIYNLEGQIHGFSGRTVLDSDSTAKWKHVGRKTNWVYPHKTSNNFIEESGEVILVESIGDCLALYENGYQNVLVTFGLDASSKLVSYLNSFDLKRIIVATNNDQGKEVNSGGNAAIKTVAKLSQVFDLSIIKINPPLSNDFGDMQREDMSFSDWYSRSSRWSMDDEDFQHWILKKINQSEELKKNTHCKKLIKILNG
jgi:DNA primase